MTKPAKAIDLLKPPSREEIIAQSLRLPESLHKAAVHTAKTLGVSLNHLICVATGAYIDQLAAEGALDHPKAPK